jgi:hypothetical protein
MNCDARHTCANMLGMGTASPLLVDITLVNYFCLQNIFTVQWHKGTSNATSSHVCFWWSSYKAVRSKQISVRELKRKADMVSIRIHRHLLGWRTCQNTNSVLNTNIKMNTISQWQLGLRRRLDRLDVEILCSKPACGMGVCLRIPVLCFPV